VPLSREGESFAGRGAGPAQAALLLRRLPLPHFRAVPGGRFTGRGPPSRVRREVVGTGSADSAGLSQFAFTTLPLRTIPPGSASHREPAS
jgi:hypothetical protein